MKLNKIKLLNYRNISELSLDLCENINVFYGDNAQGKTNLIEAIWNFTGNQSFRGSKRSELLQIGKESFKLEIDFSDNERSQSALIEYGQKKRILLNNVAVNSQTELNGSFYAVVFSPSHLSLIKDGPKNRRHFIDIAISEIKPQYRNYLLSYEKILNQRNALLKNYRSYANLKENIEVWDYQLAKIGTIITIYRNDYINKLMPIVKKIYSGLSSNKEKIDLAYISTVFENVKDISSYEDIFLEEYKIKLSDSFENDIKQGFTTVGVHRDDLYMAIDEKEVRIFGSQGQQRSSVIALKLGEAKLLKLASGEEPIILLDDVMSELDENRQDYILNHVKNMQVFITCCDISNTLKLKKGRVFKIKNGEVTEINDVDGVI